MLRFKRILLVNPPNVEQGGYTPSPLGLLYLAAYLRQDKKISVKVIDGSKEGLKKVTEVLKTFKPDLVGISSLTPGRHEALKIASLIKKIFPKSKIVLGGIHPTIMSQQIMKCYPQIDYIVRGEGELILWDLVQGVTFEKILGLVWRKNKSVVIQNSDRLMIRNLDSLPFPAWDLIDPLIYPPWGKGVYNGIDLSKEIRYSIIFTRGCMGSCTFCSSWKVWRGYRYRTGKNVADEMEMLVKKFGAKHFAFYDDTLTGNKTEIINFCKEILKRKLKVAIHGTTRVDRVDFEMLKWMKKAGFYEIAYGIESGSSGMLIKINKKTDLERGIQAAIQTKKAGIRLSALMMFGLPRETKKDRELSIKWLRKIKPDNIGTVGEVWIFPGTALYIQAKNAGLIDDSFWLGKKPYYIYRGGIGGDPVRHILRVKDEIMFFVADTIIEKPLEMFFIKLNRFIQRIKSVLYGKKITNYNLGV